jgi:hypothetical protein
MYISKSECWYSNKCLHFFRHGVLLQLGNCDIHAGWKISFTNKTKLYKIWPRPKGWVQKIFQTLPPNFVEGLNESLHQFHPLYKSNGQSQYQSYLIRIQFKLYKIKRYFDNTLMVDQSTNKHSNKCHFVRTNMTPIAWNSKDGSITVLWPLVWLVWISLFCK